jgi:nitroreductase
VHVHDALRARGSTRAFLPTPVDAHTVWRILDAARYAPSGSNIQPWQVHVVAGPARDALCAAVLDVASSAGPKAFSWPYNYYPVKWREPYLARRRACGWGLYGTLGIERGDRAAMAAQELRNYDFFGAPVGLFLFIDGDLEIGSWLDCGMFLQSVMLAAQAEGLATCPQAAWAPFHTIVRAHVGAPESQVLICGLALGRADPDALVNRFRPARESVEIFATLHGFASEDVRREEPRGCTTSSRTEHGVLDSPQR